jgi:signal transduction histidine kinase
VRLSLSLAEVHRDVRQLRRTLFSGLAVARWLAEPLRTLRDAALALAQGDLSRRTALRSRDEIGELAETFDRVVARLQGTIAELAHDRRQMRAVFDTMTDGLLVTDAAGKVCLLNPAAARLLGVAAEGAAGKTVLEITLDAPLQTLLEEVLRSGIAAVRERSLRTPSSTWSPSPLSRSAPDRTPPRRAPCSSSTI